ncbi:MAG: hypothetical protein ACPGOV_02410 [Magnetovibrionaceae bacterium]
MEFSEALDILKTGAPAVLKFIFNGLSYGFLFTVGFIFLKKLFEEWLNLVVFKPGLASLKTFARSFYHDTWLGRTFGRLFIVKSIIKAVSNFSPDPFDEYRHEHPTPKEKKLGPVAKEACDQANNTCLPSERYMDFIDVKIKVFCEKMGETINSYLFDAQVGREHHLSYTVMMIDRERNSVSSLVNPTRCQLRNHVIEYRDHLHALLTFIESIPGLDEERKEQIASSSVTCVNNWSIMPAFFFFIVTVIIYISTKYNDQTDDFTIIAISFSYFSCFCICYFTTPSLPTNTNTIMNKFYFKVVLSIFVFLAFSLFVIFSGAGINFTDDFTEQFLRRLDPKNQKTIILIGSSVISAAIFAHLMSGEYRKIENEKRKLSICARKYYKKLFFIKRDTIEAAEQFASYAEHHIGWCKRQQCASISVMDHLDDQVLQLRHSAELVISEGHRWARVLSDEPDDLAEAVTKARLYYDNFEKFQRSLIRRARAAYQDGQVEQEYEEAEESIRQLRDRILFAETEITSL